MNSVLIPVDFSPASYDAFRYGATIASIFHARVVLLHVYMPLISEPYYAYGMGQELHSQQMEIASSRFEKMEASLDPEVAARIEVAHELAIGVPGTEILTYCKKHNPGLVVLGMKVKAIWEKVFWGSTITDIVGTGDFPLLVIPEGTKFDGIHNLAFATLFEKKEMEAIHQMMDFAFLHETKFHCVHINTGNENGEMDAKRQAFKSEFRDDIGLHKFDFTTFKHPELVPALEIYCKENKIDMLAMLTHHRSYWQGLFQASITRKMASRTPFPLLIFQVS